MLRASAGPGAPGLSGEFAAKLSEAVGRADLRGQYGARALADARELFAMERTIRETVEPLLDLAR